MSNNNLNVNTNITAEVAALIEQAGRIFAKGMLAALLASTTMPAVPAIAAAPIADAAPVAEPVPEPVVPVTIDAQPVPIADPVPVAEVAPRVPAARPPLPPVTITDRILQRLAAIGEAEYGAVVRTMGNYAKAKQTKDALHDLIGAGAVLAERRIIYGKAFVFLRLSDAAA